MQARSDKISIGQVSFLTKDMSPKEEEEYARKKLFSGSYKNCYIGEVYVNGRLIFKEIEIS